jgi:protoheme IX farnesyltransferase
MGLLALTKPAKLYRLLASAGLAILVVLPLTATQWPQVIFAFFGGIAAAGAGNALNMYFERELDATCVSTSSRPIVTGAVKPTSALAFAIALLAVASVLLFVFAGSAVTIVTILGVAVYALVYTRLLKPATPYHTFAAGAVWGTPILAIWAASGKPLSTWPIVVFLAVACWTTLHTWAVALTEPDLRYPATVPTLIRTRGPMFTRVWLLVIVLVIATLTALLRQWPALFVAAALIATTAIACAARARWSDLLLSRTSIVYIGTFVFFVGVHALRS